MSFKDIFKKAFIQGFANSDITLTSIIVALAIAAILAIYIFMAYRVITRKTFYSKNFNISLACITIITAGLILTMQSNIVLSLGMVGALSIVRFRTAVKDPLDLTFLFWAISVGIICGAGLARVAVILSIVITLGILILDRLPGTKAPMILIINSTDLESEKTILDSVAKYSKYFKVKSRNMTNTSLDMVVELRTSNGGELVQTIMNLPCVSSASLLSHDGETTF